VTVIATGFEANTIRSGMSPKEEAKVVHNLDADAERALRMAAFDAPLNTEHGSVESFANAVPVAAAVATAPWEMEMAPADEVVAEAAPLAFASAETVMESAPEADAAPAAALAEVETSSFSAPLEERSPANTATFQMDAAPSLFDFDDFVIRDVAPASDFEEPTHEVEFVSPFDLGAQEAIDLKHSGAAVMEWDLPLSASPFGAANDVTAEDATENLPVAEAPEASDGIKRHTLDELLALEEALGMRKSAPAAPAEPPVPAHLRFEVKTVTTPPQSVEDYAGPASAPDPLEQRVEMAMQQMAADRRRNLRAFNHTFKSVQRNGAEEFAQVPAFQRAGVAVDHSLISQQQPLSSTSLNGDGDDLTFRTHNRFLHDNVD
jgi:hypothetical protein